MKIKLSELKQIIREEAGEGMNEQGDGKRFYREKARLLQGTLSGLDQALEQLDLITVLDDGSPVGEDPDVQSIMGDVVNVRKFASGLLDAVRAML